MIFKATLQKESSKQSLPKVTSEVAVSRCSSVRPATLFKRDFIIGVFYEYCEIFTKSSSYRTPPVTSVDQRGMVSIKNKKVCRSGRKRYLHIISRNNCNRLLLINLQQTKTYLKQTLQQRLFVPILGF